jgi:hypothetical protein
MVLLQRLKAAVPRTRSVNTKLKLRSAFNMLPVRALRFAFNFALPEAERCTAKRRSEYGKIAKRVREEIKPIYSLVGSAETGFEYDPVDLYRDIRTASAMYTGMFYAMDRDELVAYLSTCNEKGVLKRRPTEENLLTYPASMALMDKSKIAVKNDIILGLYKKPFVFMHDFSRDAIRIDMFRRSISVKTIQEETLDYVRNQIAALNTRIGEIERHEIRPVDDEEFKKGYIDRVVDLTNSGEVSLAYYMEERLDHTKSYSRIIRI